ncbi:MAG: glycerate kinase [Bacteroidota bacterium]
MIFLLAPNAMKGSLSSQKTAAILAKTLRRRFREAEIISLPVADGGNGTLDCLMNTLGGTVYEQEVTGAIPSLKANARFGITNDNVAIIESAEAVGLHLLSPSPETIAQSTSFGIGELLLAAQQHSTKEIWIGLGGTATNDGGAGMVRCLGTSLRDEQGESLRDGSIALLQLGDISIDTFRQFQIPIKILSDVQNPLLGERGATYTFARQKGATEEQLPYLEAALKNFSDVVSRTIQKDHSSVPGSGAAGGLAYGLLSFCNARIVSGIDTILDTIGFDEQLKQCDCVITTEGKIDDQTLFGKGIAGIAERAKKLNKPVHAFVGRIDGDAESLRTSLGLASLTQISPDELTTEQAIRDASWLLADAVYRHTF